jgi:CDP-diacylglycerol--glycerol-3-phosphate 3-phosphatidyltransferase
VTKVRRNAWLPNAVTLLRLPLAALYLILLSSGAPAGAFAVFCAACLTDFADGRAARALGAATALGAHLDAFADLFFIVFTLLALNLLGLAPFWFTAAVLVKFAEFLVTSALMRHGRGGAVWVFDRAGRLAALLFYSVPGIACLLLWMHASLYAPVMSALQIVSVVLALLSSAGRCAACVKATTSKT